jgi:tetratricopeptide (TPR) repeat protein
MVVGGPAFADGLSDLKSGVIDAKMGRRESAIELLTNAIEDAKLSRENRALAFATRAYVYHRGGEYPEAISDYDVALKFAPDPITYRNRGAAYLESGHYEDAADDFNKALALQPANAYFALWLHLARLKAGIDDRRELAANLARLDAKQWPGLLVAHLTGHGTFEEVTNQALVGDPRSRADRRCDMAFFLGERHLADGDADSLDLLREARDVCPADSIERAIARADILRVGR